MKKLRQSGIAGLEVLLVILLVAIVGFTGYYVWHAQKDTDKTLSDTGNSKTSTTTTTKAPVIMHDASTDSWLQYQSPSNHFTIRLADGWKFDRYQKNDSIYARDTANTTYDAGTKATVKQVDGGSDGTAVGLFINYYAKAEDSAGKPQGQQVAGFTTDQGIGVTCYSYTETSAANDGIGGLPKGGKEYDYIAKKGDAVLFVTYGVDAGAADQRSVVERSIKTFEFK